MYTTSARSPPQPRSSSPWYSRYPDINPEDDHRRNWPPPMLQIENSELEHIVFLQRSNLSTHDPNEVRQNQRTEYLGEGILTALVSDYLYHNYPDYSEEALLAMRQALLDHKVLSNICQRINLHLRLPYIGGLYNDRGAQGYGSLREWFHTLIKPYARLCRAYYDNYTESQRQPRQTEQPSSSSGRHSRMQSMSGGYPLSDPSMIARPGTAAPGLGMYATAGGSSGPTRNRGSYIQMLKEYCERHRFAPPVYHHEHNGKHGDFIKWWCTVTIGDETYGESVEWSGTKKDAEAQASKAALNTLGASGY
ncbi:hypothetical protein ABW19_dt0210480 [Dactylella cylindrospora]|nr:hypothetical protein ABW19_dt0210480 [Dactylella cylindrospora]